jgi:hypothetical protein
VWLCLCVSHFAPITYIAAVLAIPFSALQTALLSRSTSTRTRVWMLINNVSIADDADMQCTWPDGNVTYPTQLLGPVVHTHGPSARVHDKGTVASPLSPEAIVLGHADAALSSRNGNGNGPNAATRPADPYQSYDVGDMHHDGVTTPPYDQQFALSFGYLPRVFQLPVDAQDKFLQIQNVTLMQLPQMAPSGAQSGVLRGLRRLLNTDANPSPPVGIWTVLLWPVRRWASWLSWCLSARVPVACVCQGQNVFLCP